MTAYSGSKRATPARIEGSLDTVADRVANRRFGWRLHAGEREDAARNAHEEGGTMPIGIVMEFKGATLAQYDEVIKKMGLSPGGATPPGGKFHWVAKTDDGLLIVDVWETREVFDKFAEEKIGPITAEVGMPAPAMTFHEVHTFLTAG